MTITANAYPDIFPALNVAEVDVVEGAAGPGRRLVVWLQGCLKRCPGCANGPFLPEVRGSVLSVEQLLTLLDDEKELDGITLSGGEPILQAAALTPLLREVWRRGLSVVCYTGYTREELTAEGCDPLLATFLSLVDLLIDGEYRRELPRAGAYRPSSNQRLHVLSGRVAPAVQGRVVENVLTVSGGRVIATGTLPADLRRRIFEKLRAEGVNITSLR